MRLNFAIFLLFLANSAHAEGLTQNRESLRQHMVETRSLRVGEMALDQFYHSRLAGKEFSPESLAHPMAGATNMDFDIQDRLSADKVIKRLEQNQKD